MITWNRLSYTKQAIKAILENTKFPFILWIFDNGSTDGTIEYLKNIEDERIQIIFSTENVGLVSPMNEFFRWYEDTKYIAKVDNDTIVPKGWLGKLRNVMDSSSLFVVQANHFLGIPYKIKDNQEFFSRLANIRFGGENLYLFPHVGGTGILVRRKYIDKPLEEMRGTLSGWVDFQRRKCMEQKLCCAFYSGVWVDLLDMVGTNKPKYDYPEYRRKINKMRSGDEDNIGFGKREPDLLTLKQWKDVMKIYWKLNA